MAADETGMATRIAELETRRSRALAMGGPERVARHHASGRRTARERIAALVDEGTWFEVGLLADSERRRSEPVPADGVVTGYATVDGRRVGVIAIDATVLAGTTAPVSMRKQGQLIEFAGEKGFPIVILADADGGRIPDVVGWRFSGLPFDFRTFLQTREGLPPVPRIAAVLGPSYGDAALHASTAHFVVMSRSAALGLSGPSVIRAAIGEEVGDAELGGPTVATANGNAHMVVEDEATAIDAIRVFLSYMPDHAGMPAPLARVVEPATDPQRLPDIVPTQRRRAYDMYEVIDAIADGGSVFPWRGDGARSLITTFARVEGAPVGIVANQPRQKAGVLDEAALGKEHAFVDMCDTFNLPLVFLQDVPGLMIGSEAERGGILPWYEKVAARLAATKVPTVGVVIRKAFGGGHYAMAGRPTRPDFLFSWPTGELGFMDPEPGIRTVYRRALDAAEAEGGAAGRQARFEELMHEWEDESEPWEAAAHFSIDDIIHPADTRRVIATAIDIAWGSRNRVAR